MITYSFISKNFKKQTNFKKQKKAQTFFIIKINYQARWDIWSEILSESDNGWNKVPCSPTVPCLPRTETVEWRKFRWSYMGPGTLNTFFTISTIILIIFIFSLICELIPKFEI